jgi:hypothetical protein
MPDAGWNEIDQALARFLDDEPEPSDGELLAAAMTSDAGFEREVIGMLIVDDLLRQNSLSDDRAFVESLNLRLDGEGERNGFLSKFTQFFDERVSDGRCGTPFRVRFRVISVAAILLCTLSAAILGYYWRGASPRPVESSALVVPKTQIEPDLEFGPSLGSETTAVAILTRMVNLQWAVGEVSLNEGSALGRGPLRLASGLIQIEFLSGATVIIEGPCDLELLSPYKAVCHRGKLRAHVPPHAHGFTIAAPGVDAVDLGTEFAMSIDEQGRGQVHVVEGELELRGAGAHPVLSGVKHLTSGRGANFGLPGVFQEGVADAANFVDRSQLLRLEQAHQRSRHDRWLAHSRVLRNDPATIVYYSFEDDSTWERTLRSVGRHGDGSLNGAIVGCLWCPGRWPGKTALEFKRTSDRVRIDIPGEFNQLSLATWVRIEGLNKESSSLMMTDDWDPADAHWRLSGDGKIIFAVHAVTSNQSTVVCYSLPVLGPSYLGQWVHIASVYDPEHKVLAHYLNGNLVAQIQPQHAIAARIGSATIGNFTPTREPYLSSPSRSLNGRIDEFLIMRRALSGDEIKRMYELGKPNS